MKKDKIKKEKSHKVITAYSRTGRLRDSVTYKAMKKEAFKELDKKNKED